MGQYKPGDYVEIIANHGYSDFGDQWIGKRSRIKEYYLDGYRLDLKTPGCYWTDNELLKLVKVKEKNMSKKYYRVIKDLPTWETGAILEKIERTGDNTYQAVSDLWDTKALKDKAYEEIDFVVENSPEWFERVYEVSVLGKAKYLAKDAAKKVHDELHKTK